MQLQTKSIIFEHTQYFFIAHSNYPKASICTAQKEYTISIMILFECFIIAIGNDERKLLKFRKNNKRNKKNTQKKNEIERFERDEKKKKRIDHVLHPIKF